RTADSSRSVLRLERGVVRLEELREEEQHRDRHGDPRSPVQERDAATRPESAGDACAEQVREKRRAREERREADDDVAAYAHRLEGVEGVLVAERAVVAVAA